MTNVNSKFLEKWTSYRCRRPFAPGTPQKRKVPIYSLSFWRNNLGILVFKLSNCKPTRTLKTHSQPKFLEK